MNKYSLYLDTGNLRFDTLQKEDNVELEFNNINYNLILNKYLYEKKDFKNYASLDSNNKLVKDLLEYIKEKQETIINIFKDNYKLSKKSFVLRNYSKLVIGMGEVSVREVSIKLDHIYGIPFIPASSIKGAFRSYLNEKYSKLDDVENIIEHPLIIKLFGTEDQKGKLIFLDTYPEKFQLSVDIMTPHYGEYYSDGKVPVDSLRPNPIKFPVVKEGAIFKFIMLSTKPEYTLEDLKKTDLEKLGKKNKLKKLNIEKEFKKFLEEKPLGAKTSVGYGYFEKSK